MAIEKSIRSLLAISVFFAVLGSNTAFAGRITPNVYYVNAIIGDDGNRGSSRETAFATIRKGIDTAKDGDVILVYPGTYQEEVDFQGKAITIQGVAAGPAGVPVLQNPSDFAVSFTSGEGPDSVLQNFVVRNSFMAVIVAGSSPTISSLTIVGNRYGIEAYDGSDPNISNVIFWNNVQDDLFGCRARYSRINNAREGESNIDGDPLLVDPNAGDYHLFSERGRYWPEYDIWVLDTVTSPCVDAGDPSADPADEPVPNGGRINMGAYGGTIQASLSPSLPSGSLPGQASEPSPAEGAVGVGLNTILNWTAGANTVTHLVYFGTELSPPLVGNQTTTGFDPGPLDHWATYFWRIDEVNSYGKTPGRLWNFTTIGAPKGRTCFTSETGVWVDGALIPISKACQGKGAGGMNGVGNGESLPSLGKIEEVQEHEGIFECYDVVLENGHCIAVAENHFFLTESGQWIALQNLTAGTRLQTPDGLVGIARVTKRPLPYVGKVYNLRIEGVDRYLVGEDAIVVRDY
jgi:hypothetical protein